MQPLLLCVHMDSSRLLRVSMSALSMGIAVKEVTPDQWGQSLAALCGLEPMKDHPPAVSVSEEMIIFAHFPNDLLDRFLAEMKKAQITVRLKAVLTPHNRQWNPGFLCAALHMEAQEMDRCRKGAKQ